MSGLLISGLVVGGFGLLILIIGSILMATAKACTTADEACNSVKNRKKVGVGMAVMGCVLMVVGGVLLFLKYRHRDKKVIVSNSRDATQPPDVVNEVGKQSVARNKFNENYGFDPKKRDECDFRTGACSFPCIKGERIMSSGDVVFFDDCSRQTECVRDCSSLF